MDSDNQTWRVNEVSNKNHVADVKYAVQHTRWILTILGIWPSVASEPTRFQRYFAKIALPFSPIAIAAAVGSIICHAVIRAENFQDTLEMLGPISYQTANTLKNLILICRRGGLKLLIEHMEANWRRVETPKERGIMIEHLKRGRNITTICGLGMYASSVGFFVAPYFAEPYINELNQSVRLLPYPGPDMLLDIQSGHNYEIVYFTSTFLSYFNLFVHLAIYNLASVLVTHACGQMQIVISRLDDLVGFSEEANDIVVVNDRIAFIVRNHVKAIRFATKAEEFLREICLVEVVATTVMICWAEYWFLTTDDLTVQVTFFLLLISYITNLFVFCYVGELLQEQFEQIGESSYMIEWHRLPGKTSLALIMVITMANYPCKLTAGKMMELSYFSFGSVMKASFAYLNMMRSMAQ